MATPSVIILQWICPLLGVIAANQMFLAPLRSVRQAVARGSLGDLNPLPWAVMLGNCIAWVLYSFVIQNYFIFFANAPGLLLSVYFNLAASQLLYQQQFSALQFHHHDEPSTNETTEPEPIPVGTPTDQGDLESATDDTTAITTGGTLELIPTKLGATTVMTDNNNCDNQNSILFHSPLHNFVVVAMVAFWLTAISILSFVHMDAKQQQMVVGLLANAILVFFYGAPLSTIATILRTKSTATLHVPTMLTNTANGTFWCAYGIAIVDWFVILPNGLGAVLGAIQMVLFVIFPRKQKRQQRQAESDLNNTNGGVEVDKKQDKAEHAHDVTDRTLVMSSITMSHPFRSQCLNMGMIQEQEPENPIDNMKE